jgi:hypothetical protein
MALHIAERNKPVQRIAGAFQANVFQQNAFDTGYLAILDNGTAHRLPVVFRSVSEMWAALLTEWVM